MIWCVLGVVWVLYVWMGAFTLGVAVRVYRERDNVVPPFWVMFVCAFGWPFVLGLGERK